MQSLDLIILSLACYLLTDALVNRALPFGVMARIRDKTQWQVFQCFYCAAFWCGIVVYLLWLINLELIYPLAVGGGAILLWRHTGGNHV